MPATAIHPSPAADLTRMPQVNRTLTGLGLGLLAPASVRTLPGRNTNWAGTTDRGVDVFVKHIGGAPDAAGRLRRVIAVETQHRTDRLVPRPRCLGWDERAGLVVFELLSHARDGAALAEGGEFTDLLATRAGRLVAGLHGSEVMARCAGPATLPPAVATAGAALSMDQFLLSSGAELHLWRLLQRDHALATAVRALHRPAGTPAPVHHDLRLDQFLLSADRLYLADWEELRLADPARDIGSFAGEWLYRSLVHLPGDDTSADGAAHEHTVARGVRAFERVRSRVTAFWAAYLAVRSRPDPDLATRATAHAGWHLFERLFAGARDSARLGAPALAVAGIARRALLAPASFTEALGLVGAP